MLTDPNLIAAQASLKGAQATIDNITAQSIPLMLTDLQSNTQIGQQWQQTCDSKGPHTLATLSWASKDRMGMTWLPTVRTPQEVQDYGWDNLYLWRGIPVRARDWMIYDLGITFSLMRGLNAPEHELHIVRDKLIYNTGVQYGLGKTVRVFNFSASPKTWVDTGIPVLPNDF